MSVSVELLQQRGFHRVWIILAFYKFYHNGRCGRRGWNGTGAAI
jgi:hypothetical protein